MIGNLSKVQERLRVYAAPPDQRFNVKSGLSPQEEAVKEKVRQYWADQSVPNVKKLEGLNIDLKGFDPRHTTPKELRSIGFILEDLGIIDSDLIGAMSSIDIQFDSQGNEINMDRQVDAYAFMERHLEFLGKHIAQGNDYAKGALVDTTASIAILMALEERAKTPRLKSLVNIRV
ncbi:hypothetical protein ACI2KS_04135 [Pseudomonas sp. NPDC087358]|uniref:hypothetical protein n=1 Tax=Pseudomonas sp. NPDC087358 TaxID=3364439 RepID=UPI00384EFE9E